MADLEELIERVEGLGEDQAKVLAVLYHDTDAFGENCIYFRTIADRARLSPQAVGKAARELRSKGYAQFMRGLMTDDGRCAGAGYAITSGGVFAVARALKETQHDR